ncbi:MAG: YdcF family protein [Lawsonibacter sp.]|nr:YdcF family protein [Lawsonibacter sp.]
MKRGNTQTAGNRGRRFPPWLKVILALALTGVLFFALLLGQVMRGARDEIYGDPQVMVILGCQVKPWGPSVLLQDRLDKALEYLEDHPDMTVVVSGGQGPEEPTTEAQAMADYLADHGFKREHIILEAMSHNTYQNFTFTARHLEDAGIDTREGIVIVSNGFHLTRARMLAGRVGFENVSTLAAPSSHTPSRLKMYVREPLALVKSFIFDR